MLKMTVHEKQEESNFWGCWRANKWHQNSNSANKSKNGVQPQVSGIALLNIQGFTSRLQQKKSPKTKGDTLPVRTRNKSALPKAKTCHQLDQGDLPMLYLPARIKFTSAEASAIVHIQCPASN